MNTAIYSLMLAAIAATTLSSCGEDNGDDTIEYKKADCACKIPSSPGYNAVFFETKPALIYGQQGDFYMEVNGCTNTVLCAGAPLEKDGKFQLSVGLTGWETIGSIKQYYKAYGKRVEASARNGTIRSDEVNQLVDRCWTICDADKQQCQSIPSNSESFSKFSLVLDEIKKAQSASARTENAFVKISAERVMDIFGIKVNTCERGPIFVNTTGFYNEGKRCGVPLEGKVNNNTDEEPFISGKLIYEKEMKARLVPGELTDARFETEETRPYLKLDPPYDSSMNGQVLGLRHRTSSNRQQIDFFTSRHACFTTFARK